MEKLTFYLFAALLVITSVGFLYDAVYSRNWSLDSYALWGISEFFILLAFLYAWRKGMKHSEAKKDDDSH
ncbi:MAG: hypothetical protein A3J48_00315 [Candidatus Doudnabacteria bacterium RIFCSPHIGHO2_02_FULL_46_11]|uniref:Uncharacterized protein n=1 Tax=Candidatus Doudnabacteria bacterium RIFCSPHIGHO2_02_FULL_46_11 TaxID=1817832 RepID=A0A1F5P5K7_9BACT|nr:MAG: hypothetical protein A3J48_00315 [Candidatus Doudnabacteria bacterium RIFCSPHIGHO2_02_FULL_46_11]